ncbi:hypothetical protein JCM3263A_22120 [Thermobifida fusca]|uniref:Uncharacterized protein n=2 Tax=Thermobifida fusca TaxID=2021 RepID=A0A9P2T8G0_THEFU|nr:MULTISPECIES: hypothetical protein [Thermobifida]AAZ57002.1 hypothetical protein Tfu_2969 [Thermobifida fusca YX]EOR69914.1 hypothetical protein TM51_15231 [Thermobifida fusca TM51]MBO2530053.1 hypothetical protein [Thermobifida sp.]MDD6792017.1 hypothetical protein [Thermobifida fusca]PPS94936.1 hypothetical protein BH05_04075 [Thermobifida fusca]
MNEFLLVLAGGAVSLVTSATVTWLQGRYARKAETRAASHTATRQLTRLLIAQRDAAEEAPSTAALAEAELLAATITARRPREAVQEVIRLLRECTMPELEQLSGVPAQQARQLLCDYGLAVLGAHLRGDRLPQPPETVRNIRRVEEEALKIRAGGVSEASAESAESGADEPPAETAPKITSRKVRTKPRTTRRAAEADPLD